MSFLCVFKSRKIKKLYLGTAVRRKSKNAARKALDWEAMARAALDPSQVEKRREPHKKEEVCAMCGKFCAVKMLRRD